MITAARRVLSGYEDGRAYSSRFKLILVAAAESFTRFEVKDPMYDTANHGQIPDVMRISAALNHVT